MDKIQKIRKEIERIQLYSQSKVLKQILDYIDEVQEEPVSDDLEEAAKNHAAERYRVTRDRELAEKCKWSFKAGAKWQEKEDQSIIELAEDHAMLAGMEKMKEQMMKNIWKDADGDDLPEIDKEVIVLAQKYPLNGSEYVVSFAHRPNPDGWDAKSIITEKVEHYTPQTYDKGGWSIPDVKWWLDCEWPNEEE